MRFALSAAERRVGDLVRELDRDGAPAAETWRRVGEAMQAIGRPRPSYGHVRRLVLLQRERREIRRQQKAILKRMAELNAAGRVPPPNLVIRLVELNDEEELVFQEHKAFVRPP